MTRPIVKYLDPVSGGYEFATVVDIGDLRNLNTTIKSDIVGAINSIISDGVHNPINDEKIEDLERIINSLKDGTFKIDDFGSIDEYLKQQFLDELDKINEKNREEIQSVLTQLDTSVDDAIKDYQEKVAAQNIILENAESTLADARDTLEAKAAELETANIGLSEIRTEFDELDNYISTSVRTIDFDNFNAMVEDYETVVTQTSDEVGVDMSGSTLSYLTGRVTDAEANISAQADEITSKMSYDEFQYMPVPKYSYGENLLFNTFDFGDAWNGKNGAQVTTDTFLFGKVVAFNSPTGLYETLTDDLTIGESYVFSTYVNVQPSEKSPSQDKYGPISKSYDPTDFKIQIGGKSFNPGVYEDLSGINGWIRINQEFVADAVNPIISITPTGVNSQSEVAYMAMPKVEQGLTVTPWQPHVEDNYATISSTQSMIKQQANSITAFVTEVSELDDSYKQATSTFQMLADGFAANTEAVEAYEDAVTRYGTEYSNINGKFEQKVWKDDFKTVIEDINIDNRNRVLNSDFIRSEISSSDRRLIVEDWSLNSDWEIKTIDNDEYLSRNRTGLTQNLITSASSNYFPVRDGERILFGFDLIHSGLDDDKVFAIELFDISNKRLLKQEFSLSSLTKVGNRYHGSFSISTPGVEKGSVVLQLPRNGSVSFTKVSFQNADIGSVDWSPAPEDSWIIQSKLATYISQVEDEITIGGTGQKIDTLTGLLIEDSGTFTLNPDKIATEVLNSQTYDDMGFVNKTNFEQTADGWMQEITSEGRLAGYINASPDTYRISFDKIMLEGTTWADVLGSSKITVTDNFSLIGQNGKPVLNVSSDGSIDMNVTSLKIGEYNALTTDDKSDIESEVADKVIKTTEPYMHIAYADTEDGQGISFNPSGKQYIGFAKSHLPTPSGTASNYTWSKYVGADGYEGADGVGIKSTTVRYVTSTSGANKPSAGWSLTIPKAIPGSYLWTEIVWEYTNNEEKRSYTVTRIGVDGADGKDGVVGKDGVGIKSTTITYGISANETTQPATYTGTVPTLVKGQYLWTKTVWVYTDDTTETGYTKTYIPKDGNDGTNGIVGKDGVGISKTTITYAKSSSGTTAPTTGYKTTVPSANPGEFIWTKTVWAYTDNTTETGYSVGKIGNTGASGKDGNPGKDGVGIQKTELHYASSTSGTAKPSTGWNLEVPSTEPGDYLWTRTTWTYTDEDVEEGYSVSRIGKDGNTGKDGNPGKDGVGITDTVVEYAKSTNGITAPTSGWASKPPSGNPGDYIWTRTTWSYTDNTTEVGYSVGRIGTNGTSGKDGAPGKDGVGITDTVVEYGSSTSGTTKPTAWTEAVPTVEPGNYQWTRTTWIYTDGTSEIGYTNGRIGKDGNTGKDGLAGKDGVGISDTVIMYATNSSGTTKPTAGWDAAVPTVSKGNYLWTRTVWTYTDTTTEVGYSVARMGIDGNPGQDAITIVLSNEAHTFVAGITNAEAASDIIKVDAYKGTTKTPVKIGTITGTIADKITATITNNNTTNAQITINVTTALTTSSGNITIPITVDGKSFSKVYSWALSFKGNTGSAGGKGETGAPGANAKLVTLTATGQIFTKPKVGSTTPSKITVTASGQNTTISTSHWQYSINGGAFTTTKPAYVTVINSTTVDVANTMSSKTLAIKVRTADAVEDTLTIARIEDGLDGSDGTDGTDATIAFLSNESHTFAGDINNAIAATDSIEVTAYKGSTKQNVSIGTITGQVTGLTAAIASNTNNTTSPKITITVTTALKETSGTLTIPLTVNGTIYTRYYSWSVARKGATGSPGGTGSPGAPGSDAQILKLTPNNQVFKVPKTGAITPATITITATGQNISVPTANANWQYSVNGGTLTTTLPKGVNRSNAVVTVNGTTFTGNTLTIKVLSGTIQDTVTIYKAIDGVDGDKGAPGADGKGIISQTVTYQVTTSGTTTPGTTGWGEMPDTKLHKGKYLWQKTNTTYTIGNPIDTYLSTYIPLDGQTGAGISNSVVHYIQQTSSTQPSLTSTAWNTTRPAPVKGQYLWTKTTISYTDNTPDTVSITSSYHAVDGQSQWVYIRYSANSNGSGMTPSPSGTTKYVGIAVTNSATVPAYTGFTWSKYIGENGAPGPQGVPGKNGTDGDDGVTTYTWVRYADTPTSGMNQYPAGKKYIGLAFNQTTQDESESYDDYQWSLMPQNIEIGGRNLLRSSDEEVSNGLYNIAKYDLTDEIKENEEVTLTIWGSLAATKSYFSAYNSGGSINVATLTDNGDGTYSKTFKWKIGSSTNTYLDVYAFTNAQTGISKINKIKLERGNTATDWTPAPEDTQSQIDGIESGIGDLYLADKTGVLSGQEIYTDKADDDGVVHVEVDGKSYQYAGSGKNLFIPPRVIDGTMASQQIDNRDTLSPSGENEKFYEISGEPNKQYTFTFNYKHTQGQEPNYVKFFYSDGTDDGKSQGALDKTTWTTKSITSKPNKTVVGIGYHNSETEWRVGTLEESIPFSRTVINDSTKLASESYIRKNGVNGKRIYSIEYKWVNGVKTSESRNKTLTSTVNPVNEEYVQGTMNVVWKAETYNESIKFSRTTIDDKNVLPANSYIRKAGVNGSHTYSIEYKWVNNVKTSETRNKKLVSTKNPVNEEYVRGTMVVEWKAETSTETIAFTRTTQDNSDIYPNESYVSRAGVNGSITYNLERKWVNGASTSETRNKVEASRKNAVNEIYIRGTKSSEWRQVTTYETIPYTTVRQNDNTIEIGTETVGTVGKNGRIKVITEHEYVNNSPTGEKREVSRVVDTTMVPKVIKVGTKPKALVNLLEPSKIKVPNGLDIQINGVRKPVQSVDSLDIPLELRQWAANPALNIEGDAIEPGKEYTFAFKYEIKEGSVKNMRSTANLVWWNNKTYMDGELVSTRADAEVPDALWAKTPGVHTFVYQFGPSQASAGKLFMFRFNENHFTTPVKVWLTDIGLYEGHVQPFGEASTPEKVDLIPFSLEPDVTPSTTRTTIDAFANKRTYNLVTDFGAVGDGVTDNFAAIKQAILSSVSEPVNIVVPAGNFYYRGPDNARLELWPNTSKGIRFIGQDGSVLLPDHNRTQTVFESYVMQLVFDEETSIGFAMEGLTIDGINAPQDIYHTMPNATNVTVPTLRGIIITGAQDIVIHNSTFKNIFGGYTILASKYKQVDLSYVELDRCGGNAWTESFGGALYFSGHYGDATINIDNVHAEGYTDSRYPKLLGWIGIIFENGSVQLDNQSSWVKDVNTYFNITNSSFLNYETGWHVETVAGNTYWNSDNVLYKVNNYAIVAALWGEIKEASNRVKTQLLPFGRTGLISGMYYSEKEASKNENGLNDFRMYNSYVDVVDVPGFPSIRQAMSYGDSVHGKFYNTTFNNIPNGLVTNGSTTVVNSEINLSLGNPKTDYQLQNGEFSRPVHKVTLTNTNINRGVAKIAAKGSNPAKVKNTGYTPPPLTKPLGPATLEREG